MTTEINTKELIEKITQTFYDYDNDTKFVGILDFMNLLIQAAKLLDKHDKELTRLYERDYNVTKKW